MSVYLSHSIARLLFETAHKVKNHTHSVTLGLDGIHGSKPAEFCNYCDDIFATKYRITLNLSLRVHMNCTDDILVGM